MATKNPYEHWQLIWDPLIRVWYPVPPLSWVEYELSDDVYFEDLEEAFSWIEEEYRNAPVPTDDLIERQRQQVELETVSPAVPVAEPPRRLSRGEAPLVVNPISSQSVTQSRRERLAEYEAMVGLR